MADESKDSASKEELSVCARWLHDRKVVEHFLGIIHVRETTAKSISDHLIAFLKSLKYQFNKTAWVLALMVLVTCRAIEVVYKDD